MAEQDNSLIKGAMVLSLAGILVKLISILYKLPLTNLVGVTTMGYFNTVYPLYLMLTAILLTGIPATLSKLVAEESVGTQPEKVDLVLKAGFFLAIGLGLGLSLFFGILPFYAHYLNWEPEIRYVLWGLAISPFLIALIGVIRGYYQGHQNMLPTAISQVIENIIKVCLGVLLVFWLQKKGFPGYLNISGATVGISLGFLLSFLYLVWQFRCRSGQVFKFSFGSKEIGTKMLEILWIALPITLSTAMISIMGVLDSTLIYPLYLRAGKSLEEARIALSSVTTIQTVINVPLAVSAAIAVSILPAIAIAKLQKDGQALKDRVNTIFQLTMKIALPSVAGIWVLAEPILKVLYYKEKLDPYLLQIYSLCMLFMILAQVVSSILQGLSGYYKSLLAVGMGVGVKALFNVWFLKMGLGAIALIYASIPYFIVILIVNYYFLNRELKFRLNWSKFLIKPLVASGGVGITAYGLNMWLTTQGLKVWLTLILAIFAAIIVYAAILLGLKGFSAEEILILPKGKKILKFLQNKKWMEE